MLNAVIIGGRIADARKKLTLSQAQLAQQLFISAQAVGKWERGESMPDIVTLKRLSDILEVDLNYFTQGSITDASDAIRTEPQASGPNGERSATQGHKPKWDMSKGNWVDADFSGLKNLDGKFSSSNMLRSVFTGADLSGLNLKNNNVDRCDFSGADINSSQFVSTNIVNSIFTGSTFRGADFFKSYVQGSDFTGSDFSTTNFRSGGFAKNTIVGAVWNGTSFNAMHIDDIAFNGTLEDCTFENCSFRKVSFQSAKLINTFFKNNSLKGIRFVDCQADHITYQFLKSGKADLTGISLLDSQ